MPASRAVLDDNNGGWQGVVVCAAVVMATVRVSQKLSVQWRLPLWAESGASGGGGRGVSGSSSGAVGLISLKAMGVVSCGLV